MSASTTRIVLYNADWNAYQTLYAAMGNAGFTDLIRDTEGLLHKMPDGEYDRPNNTLNPYQVRDVASRAAASTGCNYTVFVTQDGVRTWMNLPLATPQRQTA